MLGNFGWVGIAYAASSLIAGLLYLAFRTVGIGVLVAGVPIIVMLLSMLHIYFRKRELDDAANAGAHRGRRARGRVGRAPRARSCS